jgi:hypothetical protein
MHSQVKALLAKQVLKPEEAEVAARMADDLEALSQLIDANELEPGLLAEVNQLISRMRDKLSGSAVAPENLGDPYLIAEKGSFACRRSSVSSGLYIEFLDQEPYGANWNDFHGTSDECRWAVEHSTDFAICITGNNQSVFAKSADGKYLASFSAESDQLSACQKAIRLSKRGAVCVKGQSWWMIRTTKDFGIRVSGSRAKTFEQCSAMIEKCLNDAPHDLNDWQIANWICG